MNTFRYFRIFNNVSGLDLGIFGGEDADAAIRLMLDDAGVADDEAADASVEAVEVDAATVSDLDKTQIEALRERYGWND